MSTRWTVLAAAAIVACASPPQREIVFARASGPIAEPGTVIDIFAMQPDGSGVRQITHGAGIRRESNGPAWSPDGTRIAYFASPENNGAGRGSIRILDASGANDRLLVELDSLHALIPAWSPDGRRLVFTAIAIDTTGTTTNWIYVIGADGTGLTRISRVPMLSRAASPVACASWLPDGGALLVSESGTPGPSRILRMEVPSGETRVLLESDTLALQCPFASPAGDDVLLTAWPSRGPRSSEGVGMNIYRMDLDGGDLRPFVVLQGFAKDARWSPDGRHVVFHGSDAPNYFELPPPVRGDSNTIFTTDRYGRNLTRVISGAEGGVHPGW